MPASVVITSAVGTGLSKVSLEIAGRPKGQLRFKAARRPHPDEAGDVPTGVGPPFIINFQQTGGWYVWAVDDGGMSVNPAAVWAGYHAGVAYPMLEDVGQGLATILSENRPLIDAAMHPEFAPQRIAQVAVGTTSLIDAWPSICVSDIGFDQESGFMPFGREVTYIATISAVYHYNDKVAPMPVCRRICSAVTAILSSPAYNEFDLPSGVHLVMGMAKAGREFDEAEANGFYCGADANWSGSVSLQQTE